MCEACRTHSLGCPARTLADARPDQIRRLLLDILNSTHRPEGSTA